MDAMLAWRCTPLGQEGHAHVWSFSGDQPTKHVLCVAANSICSAHFQPVAGADGKQGCCYSRLALPCGVGDIVDDCWVGYDALTQESQGGTVSTVLIGKKDFPTWAKRLDVAVLTGSEGRLGALKKGACWSLSGRCSACRSPQQDLSPGETASLSILRWCHKGGQPSSAHSEALVRYSA